MERALTLISTGTLTIEMARSATRGKAITLPRTLNRTTGKNSVRHTGFSDAAWGKATRSYTDSAHGVAELEGKFDLIIKGAQEYMKHTQNRATEGKEVIDVDKDERACLIYVSDSEDSDCGLE